MVGSLVRAGGRGLVWRPENKVLMEEEEEEEEESLSTGTVAVSVCDIFFFSSQQSHSRITFRIRQALALEGAWLTTVLIRLFITCISC